MKFGRIGTAFESLREVYAATDTDGNGTIDIGEFTEGAMRMGYTLGEEEKKEIFEAADIDGNRDIDFKEFIVMCALLHVLEGESKAEAPAAPGELAKNVKEAFELAIAGIGGGAGFRGSRTPRTPLYSRGSPRSPKKKAPLFFMRLSSAAAVRRTPCVDKEE